MLSDRYKDALIFAAKLHDTQTRKGSEIAYLSHLLAVSGLVMENGGNEDEAIAGLLHDALEDQGDNYTSEYLVEPRAGRPALKRDLDLRYGSRVREIVEACTDDEDFQKPPADEKGTVEAWRARKEQYLAHLAKVDDAGILRVSCSDKLHNARTILIDYEEHGEAIWDRFRAGTKEQQLWYYRNLVETFQSKAKALNDIGLRQLSRELWVVIKRIE
jgi:(p)ppGpp synthase/HD superfamily hydrolase